MDSFAKTGLNDVSLVLIGSKPNTYYHKCVKYAEKLKAKYGLDIQILDGIERNLFPAIIKKADLFAMTSKWEEYPVSLVEAMAVGTPFLSTPVGNAHILPGGITSRYDEELPSLLKTLLSNHSLLEQFGYQGKEYALKHNTLTTVLDNYELILKSF